MKTSRVGRAPGVREAAARLQAAGLDERVSLEWLESLLLAVALL